MPYGYIKGKVANTRDEYVCLKRGFDSFASDEKLLEFAKEKTGNWYQAGNKNNFTSYYLSSNSVLNEPYYSLTDAEFKRLVELQKEAIAKETEEKKQFDIFLFEGKPLTEDQVLLFLARDYEKQMEKHNNDVTFGLELKAKQLTLIKEYHQGNVIPVFEELDLEDGLGTQVNVLYSDGTIKIKDFYLM